MNGSILYDDIPRYPIPQSCEYLPLFPNTALPMRLQELLLQLEADPTETAIAGSALRMMYSLVEVINRGQEDPNFWHQDLEALRLIGPCLHFLLSMPRLPNEGEESMITPGSIIRELVRLTCLLLISGLRRKFSLPATERASLQERFTFFIALFGHQITDNYHDLKIWALYTAMILQEPVQRQSFADLLAASLPPAVSLSMPELQDIAREIIWIEGLAPAYE